MKETARRVVIVGFDGVELLDIACPSGALDAANHWRRRRLYRVELATLGGRSIGCSSGLSLGGQLALEKVHGPLDTLLVAGGPGDQAAARNPMLVAQVRRLAARSRRVASVCSGALILAAAGLLDGRRVTTHWLVAADLAARFPAVTVDPNPLYIRDGDIYTSAGVTSNAGRRVATETRSTDRRLTLALIEDDHGAPLARDVARSLVTYSQRPGNQAQVSMFLAAPPPGPGPVRALVDHIAANLDADLSAAALAARAGVSARHLARLFVEQFRVSPSRYVRAARTEAAAQLLVSTALPMTAIARRCGFRSTETLRQAFVDQFDVSPAAYRRRHRQLAARAG